MWPASVRESPSRITGAIMRSAEMYCDEILASTVREPPASSPPLMRKGGKPSSPTYSISAPNCRRASTSTPMGRCSIRSDPVSTRSPGRVAKRAVRKRMAVPAPWMSMVERKPMSPRRITMVSSASLRLCKLTGCGKHALIVSRRLERLFEAGSTTVPRSSGKSRKVFSSDMVCGLCMQR